MKLQDFLHAALDTRTGMGSGISIKAEADNEWRMARDFRPLVGGGQRAAPAWEPRHHHRRPGSRSSRPRLKMTAEGAVETCWRSTACGEPAWEPRHHHRRPGSPSRPTRRLIMSGACLVESLETWSFCRSCGAPAWEHRHHHRRPRSPSRPRLTMTAEGAVEGLETCLRLTACGAPAWGPGSP